MLLHWSPPVFYREKKNRQTISLHLRKKKQCNSWSTARYEKCSAVECFLHKLCSNGFIMLKIQGPSSSSTLTGGHGRGDDLTIKCFFTFPVGVYVTWSGIIYVSTVWLQYRSSVFVSFKFFLFFSSFNCFLELFWDKVLWLPKQHS